MLNFKVMFKNEVVAHIVIDKDIFNIKTYTDIPYKQPFLKKPVTLNYVKSFLEKRAVPRDKDNINEILRQLGLREYNVIEILKKTHGTNFDDFLWIKFDGEHVNWDEVKLR